MSLRILSWNIKQFADKSKKPNTAWSQNVIATMCSAIAKAKPDLIVILEVSTATGVSGLMQLRDLLSGAWYDPGPEVDPTTNHFFGGSLPPWLAFATSNNDINKPDRYGVLYNPSRLEFRKFDWPEHDNAGTLLDFKQRIPARIRFEVKGSAVALDVIALHGPEPGQAGGQDAIDAMHALASLREVTHPDPNVWTVICGDFNVDSAKKTAPYHEFHGYTPCHMGLYTTLRTSFNTISAPGTYLANAYDNIFVPTALLVHASDVVDLVHLAGTEWSNPPLQAPFNTVPAENAAWENTLKSVRNQVSDHLPVWVDFG